MTFQANHEKTAKEKKAFKFDIIQTITTAIACLSLFLAYRSLQITRVEKGFGVEPKISLNLTLWNDGDAEVNVHNLSNVPISINSAYFIRFKLDTTEKKVYYLGIDFPFSCDELRPYQIMDTTIEGSSVDSLDDFDRDNYIIEARIYYSRKIDGKIYGVRSFYTFTHYIAPGAFLSEQGIEGSIHALENYPDPRYPERSRERASFEKLKLNYINKLKSRFYYTDSIITIPLKKPPSLKEVVPNADKLYQIDL
jgi:hypothetical protein